MTSRSPILEEPLWKIRLRLTRRTIALNWKLFVANKIGLIGLGMIGVFALMAISHPILMATVWDPAVYNPITGYHAVKVDKLVVEVVNDPTTEVDLATARIQSNPFIEVGDTLSIPQQPAPPSLGVRAGTDRNGAEVSASHILGTDPLGRDVLSQLLYSTRAAFFLGMIAAVVTVFIATAIGSISAYFGGWIDTVLMRFADLILLVPLLPVLIVVSALFQISLPLLGLLIGLLGGFGGTAIILKSQALQVSVKPFIDAARIAGGGHTHLIFRHIVPNVLPLSFLYMMFTVTEAICPRSNALLPGSAVDPDELGDHDQRRPDPGLLPVGHRLLVAPDPRRTGREPPVRILLPGGSGNGRGRQPPAAATVGSEISGDQGGKGSEDSDSKRTGRFSKSMAWSCAIRPRRARSRPSRTSASRSIRVSRWAWWGSRDAARPRSRCR